MNKKFNILKISGFKGILIVLFVAGCLVAGFLIFPGWICKGLWNFTASYVTQMPVMNLLHGVILWCIIALSSYALNKGKFAVSFTSSPSVAASDERIKEIMRKINEKNARMVSMKKQEEVIENKNSELDDNDKIAK